jgi:protoporphyrinogen oxidase
LSPKSIAIIGAGPAGLTAGFILSKQGIDVSVFEASDSVGGMAKTIPLWGQLVDLGPHRFFSSDPRVNKIWLEAAGSDYSMVSRLTRIYYKKKFFDYPLKAFNAFWGLGIFEAFHCIYSYIIRRLFPYPDDTSFESWVSNRFGYRLYSIFFKSYSEKLWGISCKELDADFAAQRIKKLSLYEAIKFALIGSGGNKHKTLVDEFAYPNKGAGAIYNTMADQIKINNGVFYMNTTVKSVVPPQVEHQKIIITTVNGESYAYDHVISSMPITHLIQSMGAPETIKRYAQELTFRNTIIVYLLINKIDLFPDQWIYIHSEELLTGRVTNFRNWVPSLNGKSDETILCCEYWCYDQDEIWSVDEEAMIQLAKADIYRSNLVPKNSILSGKAIKIPKCYPVYKTGYRANLRPVEQYLSKQHKLSVIGRYGAFKYNNQDHSMLMAILAAENITDGANHNLWDVNTDYEYQEKSTITATGLKISSS